MAKRKEPTELDADAFARDGYIVVDSFLSPEQLHALRAECSRLYAATTPEALVDLGCVLDPFASAHMSRRTRTTRDGYLSAREAVAPDTDARVEELLFTDLPRMMASLFRTFSGTTDGLYFFNEHYVVKPPATQVEFRWHQDDAEQLAMCVHRASIPWYLSAWCALDDVTETNGALRFLPLPQHQLDVDDPADLDLSGATAPITVAAGTAVVFRSDLWHFSAVNASATARRAFYAQYSAAPIHSSPTSGDPLCCAVPVASADHKRRHLDS
ncbi:hypothetical protein ACHHYP_06350 [Achlya hypogyna]|uniref:Phytanoyl-CoA dioxygenase n=1 Tax=Achlya hypogyna TaxID=1202772 RepID=A0A1V9YUB8_ACHHY|nr:hypothetical protein ACHHYP_06350 [Achlya hypogyna]